MFEIFSFCWYGLKALGVITYRIFDNVLFDKVFKLFGYNSSFGSLCLEIMLNVDLYLYLYFLRSRTNTGITPRERERKSSRVYEELL